MKRKAMILKLINITFFSFVTALTGCSNDSIEDQMVDNGEDKDTTEVVNLTYKEKAKETYDLIQELYKEGDLYKENYPAQANDNTYSYLWPYVGMLTAGNLLYELGYDESILEKEFEGLEKYYDNRSNLPTYQAEPVSEGSTDHYYDDSGIVAMELIDAYRLTDNQFYLDRAITITEFIMSGEDSRIGGGLYWFEGVSTDCTTDSNCIKAANTSAYAAYVTSELYKITEDPQYLTFAERVYKWTYDTLRDPSDNLYWNSIHINTEEINTRKWTYNAAMMIMSGINLYEISDEEFYLDQSIATARSAHSKFTSVINDRLFYETNDPWFNAELMTSFIELSEYDSKSKDYVEVFIRNADYAWENARTSEGQFYEDWSGNNRGRYYWLMHQAALVDVYARASLFKNE
ncbi:Glycosyl hydrolase family 76 [Salegentibacter salinarum]|nr:glycoside hydrolase family 76 protein [Salegentibacter salinarum]SKB85168.1 Glycosyl hydrolase family 76 [Salegentibacter salinarum]